MHMQINRIPNCLSKIFSVNDIIKIKIKGNLNKRGLCEIKTLTAT